MRYPQLVRAFFLSERSFIEGPILSPLLRFTLPVLLALFLQAMYGAVDLMVVGQFGQPADVSAVSTGSQVMHTVTCLVTGLSMGATVLLGQELGEGRSTEGGRVLGSAIALLFGVVALVLTGVMVWAASAMARLMQAPVEAFGQTVTYVRICSGGAVFIVAYNVLGAMFRGIADSKTPLLTVCIACVVNIAGGLLLVGACGLGVIASAGAGVAEKLCGFIMLVPSAFGQSLSAFVAQNIGAGRRDRAKKAMLYGMGASLCCGVVLAWLSFFHGDLLSGLFARDAEVIGAAADYLRAYAIDTLLTSILFCYTGYFNGRGNTTFVMAQGIVGAFLVRIPVSLAMSRLEPVSLFKVGLATPCSTLVQIALFLGYYVLTTSRDRRLETEVHAGVKTDDE